MEFPRHEGSPIIAITLLSARRQVALARCAVAMTLEPPGRTKFLSGSKSLFSRSRFSSILVT